MALTRPMPAQRGLEPWIGERHRRIDGRRAAVVRRAQRAVSDRDRDLGVGQRALEQVGAGEMAAAGQRQRRDAGAGAVDAEVAGQGSGIPRILEPADAEPFAEAPEIDPVDVAVA